MVLAIDGPVVLAVSAWAALLIALGAAPVAANYKLLPDKPNHRSSHTHLTSRAGGFAIMGAWFVGMLMLTAFSGAGESVLLAIKISCLAGAAFILGAADDKWALAPIWKFLGQLLIAGAFVILAGPLEFAPAPFEAMNGQSLLSAGVTIFWIVAFMNAFNFMDGANGLAGGAACIGLAVYSVIAAFSGAPVTASWSFLLAISCFGFLPANFSRGKIFMGDNGSQPVSFLIAALCVLGVNESAGRVSALIIPVIFLPFIFDVSLTIMRRFFRGQNILRAHREHFYQLMLRAGASHIRVAVIYMTLISVSSAAAIFMLTLSPVWMWAMPASLCVAYAICARLAYLQFRKSGGMTERQHSRLESEQAPPKEQKGARSQAAA